MTHTNWPLKPQRNENVVSHAVLSVTLCSSQCCSPVQSPQITLHCSKIMWPKTCKKITLGTSLDKKNKNFAVSLTASALFITLLKRSEKSDRLSCISTLNNLMSVTSLVWTLPQVEFCNFNFFLSRNQFFFIYILKQLFSLQWIFYCSNYYIILKTFVQCGWLTLDEYYQCIYKKKQGPEAPTLWDSSD